MRVAFTVQKMKLSLQWMVPSRIFFATFNYSHKQLYESYKVFMWFDIMKWQLRKLQNVHYDSYVKVLHAKSYYKTLWNLLEWIVTKFQKYKLLNYICVNNAILLKSIGFIDKKELKIAFRKFNFWSSSSLLFTKYKKFSFGMLIFMHLYILYRYQVLIYFSPQGAHTKSPIIYFFVMFCTRFSINPTS